MAPSHTASQHWAELAKLEPNQGVELQFVVGASGELFLAARNRWQIITSSGLSGYKFGAQGPVLTFSFKQDTAASEQTQGISSKSAHR